MASWRSTRSVEIRTAFFYLWNFPKKPLMAGVNALASDILYIGYLYILNIPVWMDCRSTTEREKWRSRICNVPRFTAEFPCPFPPFFIPNRRWSFPPNRSEKQPFCKVFCVRRDFVPQAPFSGLFPVMVPSFMEKVFQNINERVLWDQEYILRSGVDRWFCPCYNKLKENTYHF